MFKAREINKTRTEQKITIVYFKIYSSIALDAHIIFNTYKRPDASSTSIHDE